MSQELINEIFQVVLIPLLGVLTTFLVSYLKKKGDQIAVSTNNQYAQKYIKMITDTITDCVLATNQTYVEALKDQNAFTAEAQKEAFNRTYKAVMDILTDDAEEYLQNGVKDLETYIKTLIESQVNLNKTTSAVITEE